MAKNEEKKRLVDFTKLNVEVEIDKFETQDISKPFGNYIHQRAEDIGIDDIAHDIYRTGKAEIDDEQAGIIVQMVKECSLAPFIRMALIRHINGEQ